MLGWPPRERSQEGSAGLCPALSTDRWGPEQAERGPERASCCCDDLCFLLALMAGKVSGAAEGISVIKASAWSGARKERKSTTGLPPTKMLFPSICLVGNLGIRGPPPRTSDAAR